MSVVFFIVPIVLVFGGVMLYYTLVLKKKYSPQVQEENQQKLNEIEQELSSNKEKIVSDYYNDEAKLKPIKDVISDEKIIGTASCLERQSAGEKAKNILTGNRVVIVDNFYLVLTDKALHYLEFNGSVAVEHDVFALQDLSGVRVEKPSLADKAKFEVFSKNIGGNISSNNVHKLIFSCNGSHYEFFFFDNIYGYPLFDFDDATKMKTYRGESIFNYKTLMSPNKSKAVLMESILNPIIAKDFYNKISSYN